VESIRVHEIRGLSNLDFFRRYGAPGRVGLVGGTSAVDRGIRFAQRSMNGDLSASLWSHVFVFQGERVDGAPWLIESDFDVTKGRLRIGVQENRVDKYADEKGYPNAAILDFGLKEDDVRKLLAAALDFVSQRTPYALTGALKTFWALTRKAVDKDKREDEIYCSAFVRTLYKHVGVDLAPGVAVRHTTPEHVARSVPAHTRYVLNRDAGGLDGPRKQG
jgi:hypothetical protein